VGLEISSVSDKIKYERSCFDFLNLIRFMEGEKNG